MKGAIAQIKNPIYAMFFKAHLAGIERLVEVTRKWYDEPTPELLSNIETLRKNLFDGLESLKSTCHEPSSHIAN